MYDLAAIPEDGTFDGQGLAAMIGGDLVNIAAAMLKVPTLAAHPDISLLENPGPVGGGAAIDVRCFATGTGHDAIGAIGDDTRQWAELAERDGEK